MLKVLVGCSKGLTSLQTLLQMEGRRNTQSRKEAIRTLVNASNYIGRQAEAVQMAIVEVDEFFKNPTPEATEVLALFDTLKQELINVDFPIRDWRDEAAYYLVFSWGAGGGVVNKETVYRVAELLKAAEYSDATREASLAKKMGIDLGVPQTSEEVG